jgi:protease I
MKAATRSKRAVRRLAGRRIALLVEREYQELEVWYPYYRLKEEGAEVVRVGPEAGQTYPSKLGYPCPVDLAVRKASVKDFDALVIPGGWAPDYMRRDQAMIQFVQQCAKANLVLAAICHGGWMLCCTDALRGRQATSFVAIKHDMINAGARWVDRECVVDGNVITARKPDDLPAFCQAIIRALA